MQRTVIIAEAGVNHNGSIELAKKLIDAAADAKVDYVKFQTFKAEKLVAKHAQLAEYQQSNIGTKELSQYQMLKKLELTPEQHYELIEYCNKREVKFFSTAFDLESIDFLAGLRLGLWKVPSGEITNYPYLKKIAQKGQPVILSTGMCTMKDITDAIAVLLNNGMAKEQISILHCNTQYPTPMKDVNLLAMLSIKKEFGIDVGYSDHTIGIEVPIAAVGLGAKIIEKHFTLDKNMEGPDHKASIDPLELKLMVESIRNIELALGSEQKNVSASESQNLNIARKSIVASTEIKKGDLFTEENLAVKRPGTGLSPMLWEDVIGKAAIKDFGPDEIIVL